MHDGFYFGFVIEVGKEEYWNLCGMFKIKYFKPFGSYFPGFWANYGVDYTKIA